MQFQPIGCSLQYNHLSEMQMNGNELEVGLVYRRVAWASGAALCIDRKEAPLVGTADANANVT